MSSEMEKKKHFVLIHGACHGAWCWYKVATLLKSGGHEVSAIDMAASGIHHKQINEINSISDYFEPLMQFMGNLAAEARVVLVGHSMGGVCIAAAMEKFPQKISAAVFVSAMMPGPDLSFATIIQEYQRRLDSNLDSKINFDEGLGKPPKNYLFGPNFLTSKLYQLSSPEDLTLALSLVRPTPLYNDIELLEKETKVTWLNYGRVARVYIVCDQDNAIEPDFQKWMIHQNVPDEVKVIAASDHMPMFSKPNELCSCLQQVADTYI